MKNYTTNERLRVAIISKHASAKFGGEAILPLHYFTKLRRHGHDVILIVHERTREELKRDLSHEEMSQIYFTRDTRLHLLLWKISKRLPDRMGNIICGLPMDLITQAQQTKQLRRLVSRQSIDVIHQPIPVSPKLPSFTYGFDAPVVIGPMNGGMNFPDGFRDMASPLESLFTGLARSIAGLANRIIPGKRRAAILLVANERTRISLPKSLQSKSRLLVENGVDLEIWSSPNPSSELGSEQVFLYMGRLVDWKCVDILIQAFGNLIRDFPNARLKVLGDGPERAALEGLSKNLGLQNHIDFHGFLPQRECSQYLANSLALVLPSVYECGGAVVLEAMALSKPVIATEWGGPADYITSESGILIKPDSREKMVDGFAIAMRRLAESTALCAEMGAAGRRLIEEKYDWDVKVSEMIGIYRDAIAAK